MPEAAGLYYEWHGPEGAPVLILSSGLGGSANYWRPNLPALAQRHRVLVYDHRGTGRSAALGLKSLWVETMADELLDLMDALEIGQAGLIGHAAGAAIGLALALRAPDRLNRLVAVNGWAKLDPHFARCFDVRLALLRQSGPRAYLKAQPIFLYPAPWISRNSAMLDDELEEQVAHFPAKEVIERRVAALRHFRVDRDLAAITVPTLLVAAEDDMLVPWFCSEALEAGLPDAQLALMTGGHACNVTNPGQFDRMVLGWLESRAVKGSR